MTHMNQQLPLFGNLILPYLWPKNKKKEDRAPVTRASSDTQLPLPFPRQPRR